MIARQMKVYDLRVFNVRLRIADQNDFEYECHHISDQTRNIFIKSWSMIFLNIDTHKKNITIDGYRKYDHFEDQYV